MKYLLSGVAIVAALAIVAPASAQRTGPGGNRPLWHRTGCLSAGRAWPFFAAV